LLLENGSGTKKKLEAGAIMPHLSFEKESPT